MADERTIDVYIATRPEDRKRTFLRTLTLGPKESPPATIEHEGVTYSWRFSDARAGWALFCAVVRG